MTKTAAQLVAEAKASQLGDAPRIPEGPGDR